VINLSIAAAKGNFFDAPRIQRAVDKAARQKLSRLGAFVRQRAMHSIRKRKGSSKPGDPPHSHVGLLRTKIFFVYEPKDKSVVIGPVLINRPSGATWLNELGGVATIRTRFGTRSARYPARPYMLPALEAEAEAKLPDMFKNSVK
jgi:hypothetical protein